MLTIAFLNLTSEMPRKTAVKPASAASCGQTMSSPAALYSTAWAKVTKLGGRCELHELLQPHGHAFQRRGAARQQVQDDHNRQDKQAELRNRASARAELPISLLKRADE